MAYADFTTAMMAFFLLMWILASSTTAQKHAVARYFRQEGPIVDGGSVMSGQFQGGPSFMETPNQEGVLQDMKALEEMGREVREAIEAVEAEGLADQVWISMGPEGLVIEVADDPQDELFAIGSATMNLQFERALDAVARSVARLPNRVRIEGYTDARQYPAGAGYTNWELSADRANAARRRLETHGLARERFESVVGYGDGRLAVPGDPMAPGNRRITITVLKKNSLPVPGEPQPAGTTAPPDAAAAAAPPAAANAGHQGAQAHRPPDPHH